MLHLVHHILNITYTLDVNLHILVHPEVSEQPQPSPPPLPIHPRPVSRSSLSHRQGPSATPDTIVPPGVPFELPCPICQYPLEQGQICHHSDPHTTFVRQDQTEPFRIHQESPFIFCCHLPNLDNPIHTTLLWCPMNPVFHNDSDSENIPPPSLLRIDSPDAYHSTSSI